jgi:uncharacterized cupredoxin-like copper-binding protein
MAAIAAFALVVLAACGASTAVEESEHESVTRVPVLSDAAAQATREAATAATPGAAGASPTAPAAAAQSVEITANDIFFDPKEVTIPANTNVKIVLPNKGAAAHNFSIDALKISVDLPPGATKDVVVNAPPGEYEYYCNVPGHKEAGMVGKLIVSAQAAPATAASPVATPVAAAAPAAPPAVASPSAPAPETPAVAAGAAQPVQIVAHDIYFDPKELTIPANTDVTVKLPNEGVTAHNFSIDTLKISVDLPPGETKEVVINAPAGTYEYYCNVPGHKQAGMVGTLSVK